MIIMVCPDRSRDVSMIKHLQVGRNFIVVGFLELFDHPPSKGS